MIDNTAHIEGDAGEDAASLWLGFLASPAAPKRAMSLLELDGYLTGVAVAPSLIRPGLWMAGLWANEEPIFDDAAQIQSVLGAIGTLFNTLTTRIDQSLRRLELDRICDYQPAFHTMPGKPQHDAIKTWVGGFWKAMALAPDDWHALAVDERTQVIITPFVGFIDAGRDADFEPADDINSRLDEAAAEIPRAILLLRKIAQLRANRSNFPRQATRTKVGRNDLCPCGSGQKYKRCCGQN